MKYKNIRITTDTLDSLRLVKNHLNQNSYDDTIYTLIYFHPKVEQIKVYLILTTIGCILGLITLLLMFRVLMVIT